ncbi:hypothetical protein [Saccharopolyspora elongata]|nr:hypothetical protein [Saccharopolyspora elongata]
MITYSGHDTDRAGELVQISRQQATETTVRLAREITTNLGTAPG